MATAPISMPVVSPKRPNGWRPTPTMATSMLILFRSWCYAPGRSAPAPLRAGIPGSQSLRSCLRPPSQATGRNANVTTSLPSSSVRNGTITSSISMPLRNTDGSASVRRDSTFTSPGSST